MYDEKSVSDSFAKLGSADKTKLPDLTMFEPLDIGSFEIVPANKELLEQIETIKKQSRESQESGEKSDAKAKLYFWAGLSATVIMTFVGFFLGKYFG
jgi:hypothetical protein